MIDAMVESFAIIQPFSTTQSPLISIYSKSKSFIKIGRGFTRVPPPPQTGG